MIYVATIAVWASAGPALAAATRWGRLDAAQRAVAIWVSALFVQNAAMELLFPPGRETWLATWLAYPITLWLGLNALLAFRAMERHRWIALPLALVFVTFWSLGPFLGDQVAGYSHYVAPIHALILTCAAMLLLLRLHEQPDFSWLDAGTLVALATLVCYGPFLAIWPASALLSEIRPSMVLLIWETRALLLIIGALLFTRSLR